MTDSIPVPPRGLFALGATTGSIPIEAAKALSDAHGLPQVIIVAWDGTHEQVVTYGRTLGDSDNAAQGGNLVKAALHWPPGRYATSGRVGELVKHANALLDRLALVEKEPQAGHTCWREIAFLHDFLVSENLRQ